MLDRLLQFKPYFAPYRGRLAVLAALMLLATLLEGVGVGLFFPLIEYIQAGEAISGNSTLRPLWEALRLLGQPPSAGLFIAVIFGVITAGLVVKCLVFNLSARIYNPLMKDLRDDAFRKILHSHLFHFYSTPSGSLIQTLDNEVENVGSSISFAVTILACVLSLAVYVSFIAALSWQLTLLMVAIAGARYLGSGYFIRWIRGLGEENSNLRTSLKSHLIGIHQGIDLVKSYGAEDRELGRFKSLTQRLAANLDSLARATAGNAFIEGILGEGLLCLIIYLAVSRLHISAAALLTFLVLVVRIVPKITAINDGRIRIAEYLSRVTLLPNIIAGEGLPVLAWGKRRLDLFSGSLVFKDVSFSYPGAVSPALREINLTLHRNETLAIVGRTGSGKSTLARLALRLFDPTSGQITVDGVALRELSQDCWTRLIGVVSQDTFIFDDTVEANVRYGNPSASDQELREALRQARALDFVSALPQGLNTRLGERGVKLSGGERQRLSIARAFLRKAPILILDEATSAMDAETELKVQQAVEELSAGRTVIVIAHRFTTIRRADRILVLEDGRAAETGTHEELIKNSRLYKNFHELQVSV